MRAWIALAPWSALGYPPTPFRVLRVAQSLSSIETKSDQLSRELRWGLVILGLAALSLLLVAATLRPSPLGFGTHRQLGLPPCTFMALWNMPCPSCGMTTSFAYFVRGDLVSAFRCNVGGTLLAGTTALFAVWSIMSAATGRFLVRPPRDQVLILAAGVLIAITLGDWLIRISVR